MGRVDRARMVSGRKISLDKVQIIVYIIYRLERIYNDF